MDAQVDISTRTQELANLTFPSGQASENARLRLLDELYFQRATQAYLGAMPAVNMLAMRDGSEKKWGAGYNVIPVWKRRMNGFRTTSSRCSETSARVIMSKTKKPGALARTSRGCNLLQEHEVATRA